MKRLSIVIENSKAPGIQYPGNIVFNEIGQENMAFFTTHKFTSEAELTLTVETHSGEAETMKVKVTHVHEPITIGRIMNALPTEADPFPSRKYYRCFADRVKAPAQLSAVPNEEAPVAVTEAPPVIDLTQPVDTTAEPIAA